MGRNVKLIQKDSGNFLRVGTTTSKGMVFQGMWFEFGREFDIAEDESFIVEARLSQGVGIVALRSPTPSDSVRVWYDHEAWKFSHIVNERTVHHSDPQEISIKDSRRHYLVRLIRDADRKIWRVMRRSVNPTLDEPFVEIISFPYESGFKISNIGIFVGEGDLIPEVARDSFRVFKRVCYIRNVPLTYSIQVGGQDVAHLDGVASIELDSIPEYPPQEISIKDSWRQVILSEHWLLNGEMFDLVIPPDQPRIKLVDPGRTSVTVESSSFSSPASEAHHVRSNWRIWKDGVCDLSFSSGEEGAHTIFHTQHLEQGTKYEVEVAYRDKVSGLWSEFSPRVAFETLTWEKER